MENNKMSEAVGGAQAPVTGVEQAVDAGVTSDAGPMIDIGAAPETAPIVNWQAHEYVVAEKNAGWYVGLVLVGVALGALAVFLQAWFFLATIILSVIVLIIYSAQPPRMLQYSLNEEGLTEGQKLYKYADFKAFGILQEGGHNSIILVPRQRFAPRVTVFFPEESGEAIVDAFGARLPMEEVKLDFLDKMVKWLRI